MKRNRGQIIPKAGKKWLVRVYNGRDPITKKRRYVARMIEGTYKQAESALTEMSHQQDTQTFVQPSNETLTEFFNRWIDTRIATKNIAPKTVTDYRDLFARHIEPAFGALRLDRITRAGMQMLITSIASTGKIRTSMYVYQVMRAAFNQAIDWGILLSNPTKALILPENAREVKTDVAIFTPEQTVSLLSYTTGTQWGTLWEVLLTAGVRPQEASVIQWSDFDVAQGSLRITKALVQLQTKPTKWGVQTLKTGTKGHRSIGLPAHCVDALVQHRKRQAAEILQAGAKYERNDYVFATRTGGFLIVAFMRDAWKRDTAKAGLPKIGLYHARHTHISHLLQANVHPKVASERAGHATTQYTMETYTHVLPKVHRETADAVQNLLFKAGS